MEPAPSETPDDAALAELGAELAADVGALASEIGPRHAGRAEALEAAALWLERRLAESGLAVELSSYEAGGQLFRNLEVERRGARGCREVVVVGAHYDTVPGSPGANDNASGVAATLALARRFARRHGRRALRFVLFVNEEPPWFPGEAMGSRVYARRARERGWDVRAMLALETIGYYSDAPRSQRYPPLAGLGRPRRGDFLAFVGNLRSRALVRRCLAAFRAASPLPAQGAALPAWLPGVGWSDHTSFWKEGWPAVMVTDTAPYRYPWYHTAGDTPDKLDFARFALAVRGLERVVADLAEG